MEAAPSSTPMAGMDAGTGAAGPSEMAMQTTFFSSISTPLFAKVWTPSSPASYAATCVFLVVLSMAFRFLIAFRPLLNVHIWGTNKGPRYHRPEGQDEAGAEHGGEHKHHSNGHGHDHDSHDHHEHHHHDHQQQHGGEGAPTTDWSLHRAQLSFRRAATTRWRGSTVLASLGRGVYEMTLAGVAYLLMLAVMTMNVGYFFSVLGGVFLGTFVLGNLAGDEGWDRDHC